MVAKWRRNRTRAQRPARELRFPGEPMKPAVRHSQVAALLFCSGLCALIYQTAWLREFRLIFGASTAASAAVLGIFMGGLGLGSAWLGRRSELARRPLALATEQIAFVALPIHRHYEITLPILPVVAETEACAEKLARYRRVALARDLYDLYQFTRRTLDEALVRRLWVLNVWGDVIDDRRGTRPAAPDDVLHPRTERDIQPDSIGVLTRPVDLTAWEATVRKRFQFLNDLDPDETRWVTCDERHRREITDALNTLNSSPGGAST